GRSLSFFYHRPAPTQFYTLSLHDALPISVSLSDEDVPASARSEWPQLGFARGLVHEVARRTMAGKYHDMRAYVAGPPRRHACRGDRKSTRLNSSHLGISYAVFCLKKKKKK